MGLACCSTVLRTASPWPRHCKPAEAAVQSRAASHAEVAVPDHMQQPASHLRGTWSDPRRCLGTGRRAGRGLPRSRGCWRCPLPGGVSAPMGTWAFERLEGSPRSRCPLGGLKGRGGLPDQLSEHVCTSRPCMLA